MRKLLLFVATLTLAAGLHAGGNVKVVSPVGNGLTLNLPLNTKLGAGLPAVDLPNIQLAPDARRLGVDVPVLPDAGAAVSIQRQIPARPATIIPNAVAPQNVQLSASSPVEPGNGAAQPQDGEKLIDSLSADVPLMADEKAGGEEQSVTAEAAFTRKAGGKTSKRKKKEPEAPVPPPPAQPPAPPSGDDGGGPNYPRDVVKFRGGDYPSVAFRPNIPIEPLLIQAIDSAKKSLHIALYEFKLPGVLEALQRARDRGVDIQILLDYANTFPIHEPGAEYRPKRSKEIWALLREGFNVKVVRGTGEYGIMHNKFVIVDHGQRESLAEFGSYNWSWSAESQHYENAIFTTKKDTIKDLMAYWQYLESLSQPHATAKDHAWPSTVPAPPKSKSGTIDFNGAILPQFIATPTSARGEDTFEDHMVNAINHIEKSLDVSIFALRSTRIVEAIVAAKKRGKAVRVIIDEGQTVSEAFDEYAQYLAFHGVEVRALAGPDPNSPYPYAQKNHNKFAIFDGRLVETGSANYTKYAAIANFENAHFLEGKYAEAFNFFFAHMWGQAKPFAAPAQAPHLSSDSELESETRKPPRPRPAPEPHPGPAPGIAPRKLDFNGQEFPSYAFRPDTPIEPMLARAIDASQKSVRLALYEFNLESVLDALRRAKKRGLKVELVIDRSHVYTSGRDHTGNPRMPSAQIQALIAEGFDVLILKGEKGGIMHNKYAIFDAEAGGMVLFGSYNWARTAEVNHYENVVLSKDKHDVADYLAYFNYKRDLAETVDPARLEEVLSRADTEAGAMDTEDGDDSAPLAGGFPNPDDRTSKNPPPPESTAPLIDINGEQFHRHYFSPQGGIEQAWIRAIKAAKTSVDIAMFVWWSKDVADALLEAKKLNPQLAVRVLLDAGQGTLAKIDGKPAKTWFMDNGFDLKLLDGPNDDGDPMFEKMHNKMMIVDGKWVFTGSFNLSPTAEKFSFENENILTDPTDLAGFVDFFLRMFHQAWAPKPKAVPTTPDGKRVGPLGV